MTSADRPAAVFPGGWLLMMRSMLAFILALHGFWQQQPPTFRSSTEIVTIEAQVVSRDGTPVAGLAADRFEVFVDGRRRPVKFVEFLRISPDAPAPAAAGRGRGESRSADGRVIFIAIDQSSFPVSAQSSAREAARRVLEGAGPEDALGFVSFPAGVGIAPTRDREAVRQAIDRVGGLRADLTRSRFNISAVEASQLKSRDGVATQEIVERECRSVIIDPTCRQEVIQDGGRIADALEQQTAISLSALYGVIEGIGSLPGRKAMVLITAGLPMRPGGTPNPDGEITQIARRAAAGNIQMYVFYMNVHFLRAFSAEYGKRSNTLYDDITMFGYGLEKFADAASGAFFQVEVDSDPYVARVLRETSATYVLGVDVRPEDRDGRDHFIRVNVKERGTTVRYRRVVNIPRPGSGG